MNQSTTHKVKRDIRRAMGPAAVSTLADQHARILVLETFVRRLNTGFWRRAKWLLTGRLSASD